jgi:hypothetical protein
MSIEQNLELVKQTTDQSLNKDGDDKQRTRVQFKATDTETGVDWTLTFSVKDDLPASYRKVVGETNGSEIVVSLKSASQQEKLRT